MPGHARSTRWQVFCLIGSGLAAALFFCLATYGREQMLAANTAWLAGVTCLVALPVGTLLAVLIFKTDLPGRRLWLAALIVLMFMPLYVQTTAWRAGFGELGWYSALFGQLGDEPPLHRWRGAVWIHAAAAIPWVTLIVGLGLRQTAGELEEFTATSTSAVGVLWLVTLPRAAGFIAAAALWVVVTTAAEITVTDMWQLRTYAEEILLGFALDDLGSTKMRALPQVVLVGWLTFAAGWLCWRLSSAPAQAAARPPWVCPCVGPQRVAGAAALALAFAVLAVTPAVNLLVKVGYQTDAGGRSWSLAEAASRTTGSFQEFAPEMRWSLTITALAAGLAFVVAVPLASLAVRGGWKAIPALAVAAACLAWPGPLVALSLIELFNQPGSTWMQVLFDRTVAAPVLAVTIRCLPLVIFLQWLAFRSLPARPREAAMTDGAAAWQRLLHISAPQRGTALLGTLLVAAAIALGELSASFLVMPPGVTPLSVRIFQLAHYGVEQRLAGIAIVTAAIAAALAAAAMWCLSRFDYWAAAARSRR